MKDTDTIKDLEQQAVNTKQLLDRLNRAGYGMTMEELIRLALKRNNLEHAEKENGENQK